MPHAALLVVQVRTRHRSSPNWRFNAARGFVGGARPHRGDVRHPRSRFNAARGFVGGARHSVMRVLSCPLGFNAARGFVGGASYM